MKQTVIFNYLEFEIEAQLEWEGSDFSVNFFNPQTGYTNSSNPSSIMNGWSYQDPTDNYEMQNLIEAIATFYYQEGTEWVEHLTWKMVQQTPLPSHGMTNHIPKNHATLDQMMSMFTARD